MHYDGPLPIPVLTDAVREGSAESIIETLNYLLRRIQKDPVKVPEFRKFLGSAVSDPRTELRVFVCFKAIVAI